MVYQLRNVVHNVCEFPDEKVQNVNELDGEKRYTMLMDLLMVVYIFIQID